MENAPSGEKLDEHAMRRKLGEYQDHFIDAMEDDLNTADAISALFDLARSINSNLNASTAPSKELCFFALNLFNELADVLGLLYAKQDNSLDEEIEKLITERTQARKNKDWAAADRIRDELKARNVVLEDTPQGIKWKIEQ